MVPAAEVQRSQTRRIRYVWTQRDGGNMNSADREHRVRTTDHSELREAVMDSERRIQAEILAFLSTDGAIALRPYAAREGPDRHVSDALVGPTGCDNPKLWGPDAECGL